MEFCIFGQESASQWTSHYQFEIFGILVFCKKLTSSTYWYIWLYLQWFLVALSTLKLNLKKNFSPQFSQKSPFLLHRTAKKFNFLKTHGKQGVLAIMRLWYTFRLSISFQWSIAATRGIYDFNSIENWKYFSNFFSRHCYVITATFLSLVYIPK